MKKIMTLTAVSLICVCGLAACKTTVQDGSRKVIIDDNHNNHDGYFCPPGHAKKGWC